MDGPGASTCTVGPAPTTPTKGNRRRSFHTPRIHKRTTPSRLTGIKPLNETLAELKTRIKDKLGLSFEMDDWQASMIHRIRKGYDSIFVAGTGYGKSIVFEGLAALRKKRTLVIISPLKALERDQVCTHTLV
jgi:ATP-dependent helicase YprA (DUF1998 family)